MIILAAVSVGEPTVQPEPPVPAASEEAVQAEQRVTPEFLSEPEMDSLLEATGWPEELRPGAKAVAYCESRWRPGARNGSGAAGLFQLMPLWFSYAGEDADGWSDPETNARVALATVRYDLSRGYSAWAQWTCGDLLGYNGRYATQEP